MATAFENACAIEDPLVAIRNFVGALDRIAQTLDDGGEIVMAIAGEIGLRIDELDEIHGFFFRLHHPNREKFEREGWPDEDTEAVVLSDIDDRV